MALLCLGYDPTITKSIWLVKVAIRSGRQSIWVTYTSRRYTAFYTGFRCMLQLYMDLASSRLACRDIQHTALYTLPLTAASAGALPLHSIAITSLFSPRNTACEPGSSRKPAQNHKSCNRVDHRLCLQLFLEPAFSWLRAPRARMPPAYWLRA